MTKYVYLISSHLWWRGNVSSKLRTSEARERERMDSTHFDRSSPPGSSLAVSSLPLSQVNFNDTTDTPDLLSSEQATTAVECGRASYVTTLGAPPPRLREWPHEVPSLLRLSLEASKEPYFLSSVIVAGSRNHARKPPPPLLRVSQY